MITVGMNYHVLPGKQKEFEEKFQAVIGALSERLTAVQANYALEEAGTKAHVDDLLSRADDAATLVQLLQG